MVNYINDNNHFIRDDLLNEPSLNIFNLTNVITIYVIVYLGRYIFLLFLNFVVYFLFLRLFSFKQRATKRKTVILLFEGHQTLTR